MIKEATEKLLGKNDLSDGEMQQVMEEIMGGNAGTPQIADFLSALSQKGETREELSAAALVMRRHVTKINTKHKAVLDTCGTGGDKKGTFNVSTAAAFVASGCGIIVAKHGNRSVSSCCGSADILEALGVNINMPVKKIEECLEKIGIAFLFAQNLHPAMKYAMPARKQIGKKTIFNLLGPLTNPAGATHQLVGVFDARWTEIVAGVLADLGSLHAVVVCAEDGLDEASTASKTYICEQYKGKIKNYEMNPEEFGIERAKLGDFAGGDIRQNADILLDILNGKSGHKRDMVLLNAGLAIYAADRANSIKEAIGLARQSIDSKSALKKLELLKKYSQKT